MGNRSKLPNKYQFYLGGDKNVLELDRGDDDTTL